VTSEAEAGGSANGGRDELFHLAGRYGDTGRLGDPGHEPIEVGSLRDLGHLAGVIYQSRFGRTGKMFGAEWADVAPDGMCLGTARTGRVPNPRGSLMHDPTQAMRLQIRSQRPSARTDFYREPDTCAVVSASLGLLGSDWSS
jgi:hypothetical protein